MTLFFYNTWVPRGGTQVLLLIRNLHVLPKTETNLDFSIENAGFLFAVEICGFSVFAYNFYSFN